MDLAAFHRNIGRCCWTACKGGAYCTFSRGFNEPSKSPEFTRKRVLSSLRCFSANLHNTTTMRYDTPAFPQTSCCRCLEQLGHSRRRLMGMSGSFDVACWQIGSSKSLPPQPMLNSCGKLHIRHDGHVKWALASRASGQDPASKWSDLSRRATSCSIQWDVLLQPAHEHAA